MKTDGSSNLVSRRSALAGLGGGIIAATSGGLTAAPRSPSGLVDVHCHMATARMAALMEAQGGFGPPFSTETTRKLLEDMDRDGVATSILSLVVLPSKYRRTALDEETMGRESNEMFARLRRDNRSRLEFFASLPMSDVGSAVREASYALDELGACGVQLQTNYDGRWLGHSDFAPLFDELNRRGAVVYVHPADAVCCLPKVDDVPASIVEFAAETGRTIASYLLSGAARKYPRVKLIFSHSGGVLGSIAERLYLHEVEPAVRSRLPEGGVRAALAGFYYDTAQAFAPSTLKGMREIAPVSHTLFGTDYPYRSAALTFQGVVASGAFTARELRAVGGDNARTLLGLP